MSEIAAAAPDEDARKGYGKFNQAEATYPNGTHVAEVEIDPTTGKVTVVRYTVVDDYGVTVNPILLAGQLHGARHPGHWAGRSTSARSMTRTGQVADGVVHGLLHAARR